MSNAISVIQIFKDEIFIASGTAEFIIDLERENANGYFSLQMVVTGSAAGVLKGEYKVSNNNVNFVEPTGATDIFEGLDKDGGPLSDGVDMYSFEPELSKFLKVVITETGGAAGVTFGAWLAIQ